MQDLFNRIISYHDLINGDLAPDKINPASLANYLNAEQLPCKDMIVGRYKGFKLIDTFKISSANPLAKKYFSISKTIPHYLYYQKKYDQLVSQLANLRFDKLTLNYSPHYTVPVMMPVVSDWTKIENDRLRYCHINHLLNTLEIEHINEIRHFSLLNDDEESKVKISKLHRLLNSYLIEIANKYNFRSSKELELKIKKEYSIKDCAVLIYRSIVKVLDFTYKSFYQYMDFNLKIPFSSELMNNNNFLSKAYRFGRKLEKIELVDNLKSILNEELQKIIMFQTFKGITYKEYDYYNFLFKSKTSFFLKKDNNELDQEKIVNYLISINFKNNAFFEFIANSINTIVKEIEELEEKKDYLKLQNKKFNQLKTKLSYSLNEEHLLSRLLNWLDIEIKYYDSEVMIIENQSENLNQVFNKLVCTLNISELVLLIRLLEEIGVFENEKITQIVSWIKHAITNSENREFSKSSIRNKWYDSTPSSISKVETIALKLLESCKRLNR